jgi:TIR domain-containing protein
VRAPFAYDVLLSHNSKNKPCVRKLAERLRAQGLRVWCDDWVIRVGDALYAVK